MHYYCPEYPPNSCKSIKILQDERLRVAHPTTWFGADPALSSTICWKLEHLSNVPIQVLRDNFFDSYATVIHFATVIPSNGMHYGVSCNYYVFL
jgi:hypothetical protein